MQRKTEPIEPGGALRAHPHLFSSPQEKAQKEATNALKQFDLVTSLIDEAVKTTQFKLRPSTIQLLHRTAIQDIYSCAGNYRTKAVFIGGSRHQPPNWEQIPALIEEMCDYVNERWGELTAIHLSSYVMWRLNWIHPFLGGNGRTSRATSYLTLCAKVGHQLPGSLSIPQQIIAHRTPYYDALGKADQAAANGAIDLSVMEELMETMLSEQLASVIKKAKGTI